MFPMEFWKILHNFAESEIDEKDIICAILPSSPTLHDLNSYCKGTSMLEDFRDDSFAQSIIISVALKLWYAPHRALSDLNHKIAKLLNNEEVLGGSLKLIFFFFGTVRALIDYSTKGILFSLTSSVFSKLFCISIYRNTKYKSSIAVEYSMSLKG